MFDLFIPSVHHRNGYIHLHAETSEFRNILQLLNAIISKAGPMASAWKLSGCEGAEIFLEVNF